MTKITMNLIATMVREKFNITHQQLVGTSRKRKLARPRQMVMALAKEFKDLSYPQIGKYLSRDHSTVISGVARIAELEPVKENLAKHMAAFREELMEIEVNRAREVAATYETQWASSQRGIMVIDGA